MDEVIEVEATPVYALDQVERAAVDVQVTTAKTYPRNLQRIKQNTVALATMDAETAKSCSYALPRGGKPITGVSVHLARILAQQYGNLRAEAKVVEITDKQVISRGTAWDLENNYAVAFEVRRSIWGKNGRYTDDMITVTGNAANAIAYRNAVLAIIPKGITDAAYNAAGEIVTGDISTETKLIQKRKSALDLFASQYNITEKEVLQMLGKETVIQINGEQLKVLFATHQALKDGDTTVEELLKDIRKRETVEDKKEKLKKSNGKTTKPEML